MNLADALKKLIEWLRAPDHGGFSNYGYDIYISHLVLAEIHKQGINPNEDYRVAESWMPFFYDAAWELCRRGVLRPGVNAWRAQATDQGSAGEGFTITPFGRQWIDEGSNDDFVPTEPERFASMLEPFSKLYGEGFHERAQQGIRCYGAHAYLACCAMCGAAAESILLAAATAKLKDEAKVLDTYNSSSGRLRLEKLLVGKASENIQREYRGLTILLKYWRDISAHGHGSGITDNEAYTSLALLLRLALFISESWNELTHEESI